MGRASTLTRSDLMALADVRIFLTPEGAAYVKHRRATECAASACSESRIPNSDYCEDHDLCDAF